MAGPPIPTQNARASACADVPAGATCQSTTLHLSGLVSAWLAVVTACGRRDTSADQTGCCCGHLTTALHTRVHGRHNTMSCSLRHALSSGLLLLRTASANTDKLACVLAQPECPASECPAAAPLLPVVIRGVWCGEQGGGTQEQLVSGGVKVGHCDVVLK
jgi:hypothetical protein